MTSLPDDLLDYIGAAVEYTLVGMFVVHVLLLRRLTSVSIALTVFLIVQSLGIILKYPLRETVASYDVDVGRLAFYMSFAFIDLIGVLVIYRLHALLHIQFNLCTRYVVRMLQLFALLQTARLLDRQFELNVLGLVYKYAIPSINISILLVLLFYTAKQVIDEKGFSGIRGS